MGIQDLKKFLRDKAKKDEVEIIKRINISEFSGNKICVDLSTFIYKYKVIFGEDWLNPLVNLICTLKRHDIHAQFMKDGKAPPEKDPERQKRRDAKDNLDSTVFNLTMDLKIYKENGTVTPLLIDTMKKIIKSNKNVEKTSRLFKTKFKKDKLEKLQKERTAEDMLGLEKENTEHIDILAIEEYISKKEGQIVNITPEEITRMESIFRHFGVPLTQAPGEAEALGSYKCRHGDCAAILTEDTDVLTYNAPIFLSNLDTSNGDCDVIYVEDVLEMLNFTHDEFIDFCIMCGCDYNPRIPRNGPAAAFKIITQFRSIDKFIEEEKKKDNPLDYKILNHVRSRELFKTYGNLVPIEKVNCAKTLKKYKSLYWETLISFDELFDFLRRSKCKCSFSNIEEYWKEADIVFEEELENSGSNLETIVDTQEELLFSTDNEEEEN